MINLHRDITVLLKYEFMTENTIRQQVEILNKLLAQTESHESFCTAHELVDRNRIISNKKKVLKESCFINLRPFRFLINKN
jgi:predicted RNA binding protein with dsRBD fold (UPF0201 family)